MARVKHYTANNKMADLISDHYQILLLIFRFDIPLGMGDKTIKEVCEEHDVDLYTFLHIVHFFLYGEEKKSTEGFERLNIPLIIRFLRNSHSYFLDYRLPSIQEDLMAAIADSPEEVKYVTKKYFDEYVSEVHHHMRYEDEVVFPYVQGLIEGMVDPKYSIEIFEQRHDQVELKMLELKNLFIKYYTMEPNYKVNQILHDLFSCGDELRDHNNVEDYLFTPCVKVIEKELKKKQI